VSGSILNVQEILSPDDLATKIISKYTNLRDQHQVWIQQKKELRNYIFATDTSTTSNQALPWKNSTSIPKLCQIRDNLHANYMEAIFSNDDWLKWMADDEESDNADKAKVITAYMKVKLRESGFEETVSRLLYDYIDYGNVFADTEYVFQDDVNEETGEQIKGYIGPRLLRISPYDMVMNPAAVRFRDAPKYTRCIKSLGELDYESRTTPNAH